MSTWPPPTRFPLPTAAATHSLPLAHCCCHPLASPCPLLLRPRQVFVTIGQLQEVQTNLHTSVLAAVASVLVAAHNLPAKIGPVIRALMDSLQVPQKSPPRKRALLKSPADC